MISKFDFLCPECDMASLIQFDTQPEAEYYVAIHDRMQHGGHPTCRVRLLLTPPGPRHGGAGAPSRAQRGEKPGAPRQREAAERETVTSPRSLRG